MNMKSAFILGLTAAILMGCKEEFDQDACEDLSMATFKGIPRKSYLFKQHCKGFQLEYTQAKCKKAFTMLVTKGDLAAIESRYGSKIKGCFTKKDLKTYAK